MDHHIAPLGIFFLLEDKKAWERATFDQGTLVIDTLHFYIYDFPASATTITYCSVKACVDCSQSQSLLRQDAFLIRVQMLQRDAGPARDAEVRVLAQFSDDARATVHKLGHHAEL
ncbi:MAG: hypothetical protein G01um101491_19 [Parcubacteria group bacterium Gr01-1014_91]|nr:MAG: hypothetical protein G01um101491_19 [Parcubacteria group bacterium Gr01-1014_91]